CAGQRTLNAFTHRLNFAAYGLTDIHHPLMGHVVGLKETEGGLCHLLAGRAHFLGAAHHDREAPEGNDREESGKPRSHQLRLFGQVEDGRRFKEVRAEDALSDQQGSADPYCRKRGRSPIDRARLAHFNRCFRPVGALLIVVGRRECQRGSGYRLCAGWRRFERCASGCLGVRDSSFGGWFSPRHVAFEGHREFLFFSDVKRHWIGFILVRWTFGIPAAFPRKFLCGEGYLCLQILYGTGDIELTFGVEQVGCIKGQFLELIKRLILLADSFCISCHTPSLYLGRLETQRDATRIHYATKRTVLLQKYVGNTFPSASTKV